MTKHDAEQYALGAAGIVIIALTAGALWLSYAHLADVAGQHGLGTSPIRRWAWPATLDVFIVAGELLMLRAGLRQVTDKSAIAVTAIGSGSSIALNVAGVSGTGNTDTVPFLDYVVAAVPPAAAEIGHLEAACTTWHQALDDYPMVQSGRTDDRIKTMFSLLRPHLKNATARDLYERARTVAPPCREDRGPLAERSPPDPGARARRPGLGGR
ncbi:DUF2637 domain-containing protein [Streptomyces sp. NRAIS4]